MFSSILKEITLNIPKAVSSHEWFQENKGIVLELTSLLDVIMIMLFWVMTDVSASADSQKEDAKAQVQAVTQQLEEQKQKSADELENLRKNMQKQIDEAYKKAENINSNAAKISRRLTATLRVCLSHLICEMKTALISCIFPEMMRIL